MKHLIKLIMAVVISSLLVACTTISQSPAVRLASNDRIAVLGFNNNTSTPQANDRVEAITAGLLRTKGAYNVVMYPKKTNCDSILSCPSQSVDLAARMMWAKQQGIRYGIIGSVNEWRYKVGLDGEPSANITLKLVDNYSGRTLWSSVGSKVGGSRSGLGDLGQNLIGQMMQNLYVDNARLLRSDTNTALLTPQGGIENPSVYAQQHSNQIPRAQSVDHALSQGEFSNQNYNGNVVNHSNYNSGSVSNNQANGNYSGNQLNAFTPNDLRTQEQSQQLINPNYNSLAPSQSNFQNNNQYSKPISRTSYNPSVSASAPRYSGNTTRYTTTASNTYAPSSTNHYATTASNGYSSNATGNYRAVNNTVATNSYSPKSTGSNVTSGYSSNNQAVASNTQAGAGNHNYTTHSYNNPATTASNSKYSIQQTGSTGNAASYSNHASANQNPYTSQNTQDQGFLSLHS